MLSLLLELVKKQPDFKFSFSTSGVFLEQAEKWADMDLVVENAMAKVFWSREQNRDMQAIYNPMSTEEICAKYPGLHFDLMCKAAGVPAQEKVIVEQPSYFDGLSEIMDKKSLEFLKAYLL